MHGQWEARPTVTFPVVGCHCPLTSIYNTAWWHRHMCVNNLPKVVTWKKNGLELNRRPLIHKSDATNPTNHPPTRFLHEHKTFTNAAQETQADAKSVSCHSTNNVKRLKESRSIWHHPLASSFLHLSADSSGMGNCSFYSSSHVQNERSMCTEHNFLQSAPINVTT